MYYVNIHLIYMYAYIFARVHTLTYPIDFPIGTDNPLIDVLTLQISRQTC